MSLLGSDRITPALPSLILLLAGCAPAAPAAGPPTTLSAVESAPASEITVGPVVAAPMPAPPTPRVEPTRSAAECAALVDQVRAHPDSFSPTRPMMASFAVPILEGTPRDMRGQTVSIRVLVDEHGKVINDSTTVTPPFTSPSFDREMRKSIAKYRFHPAVLEGCAVPGRSTVTLTLANR